MMIHEFNDDADELIEMREVCEELMYEWHLYFNITDSNEKIKW